MTYDTYHRSGPYENPARTHSPAHDPDADSEASYRIITAEKRASDAMLKETAMLLKGIVLERYTSDSLADRIFGTQLRRGRPGVTHSEQLIHERGRLLDQHVREIDARRNDVINRLDSLRRPYSAHRPQDAARVEGLLLDLDSARRDEYLSFWRDVARERKDMLESAGEYQASKDRATLLRSAEEAGIGEEAEEAEETEEAEEAEEAGEAEDSNV